MAATPLVLFGAFDRHNLGDFLLAHAAARRAAPRRCLFAGLQAADFTAVGGFRVTPLAEVLAAWPRRYGTVPLELVHVGGEVLDTDAWEAVVMLLPQEEATARIAALERHLDARAVWAADTLGTRRLAPYVVAPGDCAGVELRSEFCAVGGVGLAARPPEYRAKVAAALAAAQAVSVRDRATQAALAAAGIVAELVPDPVAQAATLFADEIAAERSAAMSAAMSAEISETATAPRIAGDYLALQFAASFADDATLAALARAVAALPLPVVLFAAGTAPWHDDFAVYRRLAARQPGTGAGRVRVAATRDVWEVCALIAGARACVASSLHALIVAGAFGVPAVGLERRLGEAAKLRAYAETWGGFALARPETLAARLAS